MRTIKSILLISLAAIALPAFGARGRDQSYITFDDGGTVIKQGDDQREVDGRVNFPIYPGDEVTTGRRGRTEIRLADGNIIALDRSTSVIFRSIGGAYETDATQSIVELKFGHIGVQRSDNASEILRVDTPNASYAATESAVYSVDLIADGRDRVNVFDGSIEVRTPQRTTRVNQGEEARVDDKGLYGLVNSQSSADEFERWFMRRSERYGTTSRYLDSSLAYSDNDLQENGSWIYASTYSGYAWRPRVSIGWRPYYYGRWGYGPGGCLTWISYEPWGWVPYHYGRWAYDALYGWIWLPGYNYAPAWVYWAYGPGYIGWAPSGWYDCYRPYYGWAYRPYTRSADFGFGFYGRVRMNEVDLRPWTFVSPNGIVSNRVDQAALTTDAIRQRLIRDPNAGFATVTGSPARFTRSDLKDPVSAVNNIVHRGLVGGTGREGSGTAVDLTSFFRRDPELSGTVRDRIVRSRVPEPSPAIAGASGGSIVGVPSGVPTPGTRGTLEGRSDRDGTGSNGDYRPGEATGRVFRDPYGKGTQRPAETPDRGTNNSSSSGSSWRNHIDRSVTPRADAPSSGERPPATADRPSSDNWRGRTVERGERGGTPSDDQSPRSSGSSRGSDIPRRIIDRIGGGRIYSGDTPRESTPRNSDPPRSTYTAPRNDPPRSQPQPSSRPPETHSSPPPRQEQHSSPPPPKSNDGGGGGGRVKRGD
jgi:hypothetical protein